MYSAAYAWAKAINHLEAQFGPYIVTTWIDDAELVELKDNQLIIYTPSDFRQESIRRNCKQHIETALKELFMMDIELVIWGESQFKEYRTQRHQKSMWTYNPHFNFDNYIAGTSNTIPLRAAMHVAETPGDPVYNPLYLYGPPGVGKTHLLYAIANHLSQKHPDKNVVYVKGEQFTNELIRSIRHGNTPEFRKKYREADILLVDDIHFIAGKESTQEEFFHTFNELYEHQKQIVLTSDRCPADIDTLEDRLKGRFGIGVMVSITPPNVDTRVLIVRDKAQKLGLNLDESAIRYIAEKLSNNVRQIEGGLRKIRAYHDLTAMPLDLENIARTILDVQTVETSLVITEDTVVRYVCRFYGVDEIQLKSTQRSRDIAEPRQVAMYLIRHLTDRSFTEIGKYFSRDHGTVHHAVKKMDEALARNDQRLAGIIQEIKRNIESNV